MKYEKPNMEMLILDADDIVRTSNLDVEDGEGTVIPGLPGTTIPNT